MCVHRWDCRPCLFEMSHERLRRQGVSRLAESPSLSLWSLRRLPKFLLVKGGVSIPTKVSKIINTPFSFYCQKQCLNLNYQYTISHILHDVAPKIKKFIKFAIIIL